MIDNHDDHARCHIDYNPQRVQDALWNNIYTQVVKKLWFRKKLLFHELLRTLDAYTLEQVGLHNLRQNKLPCIKRPNIRAILLDKNWELVFWPDDELMIGTNNIFRTEENWQWTLCQRIIHNMWSTVEKTICATACGHGWCAEQKIINQAIIRSIPLQWSNIVLFWHTNWPCTSCAYAMIYSWVKSVIIWSPPVAFHHKDYDPYHTANGWYKMISVSRR